MSSRFTNHNFYRGSNNRYAFDFRHKKHYANNVYFSNKFPKSPISFQRNSDLLEIIISSAVIFYNITFYNLLKIIIFTFSIFITEYLKSILIATNIIFQLLNWLFNGTIAFLVFCLLILLFKLLLDIFGKMKLSLERTKFAITYSLFGIKKHQSKICNFKDIIRLEKHYFNPGTNSYLEIITHRKNHIISNNPHFLVTSSEIDLIGDTISKWLNISLTEITDLTSEELKNIICEAQQSFYALEQQNYQDVKKSDRTPREPLHDRLKPTR